MVLCKVSVMRTSPPNLGRSVCLIIEDLHLDGRGE